MDDVFNTPQKTLIPDFCYSWSRPFYYFHMHYQENSATYKKEMYAVSSYFSLTPWKAAVLADHRAPEQNFCFCPSFLQPVVNTVFFLKCQSNHIFSWWNSSATFHSSPYKCQKTFKMAFKASVSISRSGGVRQWNCPFVNFSRVFLLWPWVAFSFI